MKPEVPEGSVYRVEPGWNTRHQDEVKTLFPRLVEAARIPKAWQRCMDGNVMPSKFCSFRSTNWGDLRRKREAVESSNRLWSEVLAWVRPRLIVCNGGNTFDHVRAGRIARGGGESVGAGLGLGSAAAPVYYLWRGDGGWCSALVAVSGIFRRKMCSADGGDGVRDGGAAFQVTVVEVWGREWVLADSAGDALGTGWADGTWRGGRLEEGLFLMFGGAGGFSAGGERGGFGPGAAEGRKPVFSGVLEAMVQVELEVRGGVMEFVPPKWRWTAASSQVG